MSNGFRVRILCEDRRSESFLRGVCRHHGLTVLSVDVAPSGRGSAADWVLARYPDLVRQRRSRNFQQNLGLLVHIDGDQHGVQPRKLALDLRLSAAALSVRGGVEPVAILVPTWCIETWLLHLSGIAQPPETARLKRDPDPTYRPALRRLEEEETAIVRNAVAEWIFFTPAPPSLVDARTEARRIGIP